MTDATNLEVGGSEPAAVTEGVDTDALNITTPEAEANADDAAEVEYDDDGNPIEPEDEAEDFEFEGASAKVPKKLAEALKQGVLRQADYTKKTQGLAAERNEVAQIRASLDQEAAQRRQSIAQEEALVRDHAAELVSLKAVTGQLAEYEKLTPQDWANINAQDPDAARQHQFTYMQLKDARDRAISAVNAKAQELETARKQASDTQRQQSLAYLAREIPNWGQETYVKLGTLAMEYGYQPNEVASVMSSDPRAFKGLQEIASLREENARLKADLGKQQTAKAATAKVNAATAAAPVPQVGGKGSPVKARTTDASGDRLSPEAWAAAERSRIAQKRKGNGQFRAT